jgi:hypothetical protein
MYSAAAEVAKIQKSLFPAFREQGFASKGRTFTRAMPDGLVQVLHFVTMPATSLLYGQFAIDFGVYLPEVWDFQNGPYRKGPPKTVGAPDCALRGRVKPPGVAEYSSKEWEAFAHPSLIEAARDKTLVETTKFFDRCSTRDQIKSWLAEFPFRAPNADTPAPILLAIMEASVGAIEMAKQRLSNYLDFLSLQPGNSDGHADHVRTLISTL